MAALVNKYSWEVQWKKMHPLKTGSGQGSMVVAKRWQIPNSWNKRGEFSFTKDIVRDFLESPGLFPLHFFLVLFLTSSLPLFLGATHDAFNKTPRLSAGPGLGSEVCTAQLSWSAQCSRWGEQSRDPALRLSVLSAIVEYNYIGNLGCFVEGHLIWFFVNHGELPGGINS